MQQLKLGNNQKNIFKRKQLRVPTFAALTNGALSNLVDASAHPVGKKEKNDVGSVHFILEDATFFCPFLELFQLSGVPD